MSVGSTIVIGGETVDINQPCDVVTALKKVELKVATGSLRVTVRFDEDEVTYSKANLADLRSVIADYENKCAKASGKAARRSAIGIRWI